MVERVQKRSILAYQSNFSGSRTGIDTEEAVALVGGQIFFHYFCLSMTLTELIKFLLIMKQSADINRDGMIDAVDASIILQYYAYISTKGTDSIEQFILSLDI